MSATFAHDEVGLRSLCRGLVRLKVELVAIERPDRLLVERLLDAGLRVLALHPNQVAATRARISSRPGWRSATSCVPSWSGSGPVRSACFAIWIARSRSRSCSATRAPRTRAGWASSACRHSSSARDTRVPRSRRSWWRSSAARPKGASARSRSTLAGSSCSARPDTQDAAGADQDARAADRDRGPRPPRR